MSRILVIAVLVLASTQLFGCANRRPASSLAQSLKSPGFLVDRPPNDQWTMGFLDLLMASNALRFEREVPGGSHSLSFHVQFVDLGGVSESKLDFADRVYAARNKLVRMTGANIAERSVDPEGLRFQAYEARPETRQGVFCLRVRMDSTDRRGAKESGQVFYTKTQGLACQHPHTPTRALVAIYLDRDLSHELDPKLAAEGEEILRSMRMLNAKGEVIVANQTNRSRNLMSAAQMSPSEIGSLNASIKLDAALEARIAQIAFAGGDSLVQGHRLIVLNEGLDSRLDSIFANVLLDNQSRLIPLANYFLAKRLLEVNRDESFFWFAVAGLRTRYDAFRCVDETATRGIGALLTQAARVQEAARNNTEEFGAAGLRATEWAGLFEYSTEPRWICIHGIRSFEGRAPDEYVSESEWARIRSEILANAKKSYAKLIQPTTEPTPRQSNR